MNERVEKILVMNVKKVLTKILSPFLGILKNFSYFLIRLCVIFSLSVIFLVSIYSMAILCKNFNKHKQSIEWENKTWLNALVKRINCHTVSYLGDLFTILTARFREAFQKSADISELDSDLEICADNYSSVRMCLSHGISALLQWLRHFQFIHWEYGTR